MLKGEWKKLETLPETDSSYGALLRKTETEDEHPDWYQGPCLCRLCLSYGD